MWQTVYELQKPTYWLEYIIFAVLVVVMIMYITSYIINVVHKKQKLSARKVLFICLLLCIPVGWLRADQAIKQEDAFLMEKVHNQQYNRVIEGTANVSYGKNNYTIEIDGQFFFTDVSFSQMRIPAEGYMRVFIVEVPIQEDDGSIRYIEHTVRVDVLST